VNIIIKSSIHSKKLKFVRVLYFVPVKKTRGDARRARPRARARGASVRPCRRCMLCWLFKARRHAVAAAGRGCACGFRTGTGLAPRRHLTPRHRPRRARGMARGRLHGAPCRAANLPFLWAGPALVQQLGARLLPGEGPAEAAHLDIPRLRYPVRYAGQRQLHA
jgi:hypothetical protein